MNNRFKPYSLNIKGQLWQVKKPLVMGILNVTPDSFYAGSRWSSEGEILSRAEKMLHEGADILDLGGQSTRPGSERISVQEELERVLPAIDAILRQFPKAVISIDTFYSEVAKRAIEHGAAIVNDISAGALDDKMFETVAQLQVPYILMHMQGEPQTMHLNPQYENVVSDVVKFFSEKIKALRLLGVNDILLDPGFGFGKNQDHNIELMQHLDALTIFELPILVGISRKKMVQRMIDSDAAGALNGTTALNTIALMKGAQIIRVHDVKEAVEAVQVYSALYN
ncbi:MAG TPA: dihydropteroate synthase [Flavobacteriales bacterium]